MSSNYTAVSVADAPGAIGPYSQAIVTDSFIFTSGSIPLDPITMKTVEGGVEEHTLQAIKNLKAVLAGAGADISHVVKTTVFLQNMGDFAKMNAVYQAEFSPYKPARSAVEVAKLPLGVLVEIEAVAINPKK